MGGDGSRCFTQVVGTPFILSTTPQGRCRCHLFIDEETEAQRVERGCPRSHNKKISALALEPWLPDSRARHNLYAQGPMWVRTTPHYLEDCDSQVRTWGSSVGHWGLQWFLLGRKSWLVSGISHTTFSPATFYTLPRASWEAEELHFRATGKLHFNWRVLCAMKQTHFISNSNKAGAERDTTHPSVSVCWILEPPKLYCTSDCVWLLNFLFLFFLPILSKRQHFSWKSLEKPEVPGH